MTENKELPAKPRRGGSRPGAGRKRLEGAKTTTVILTNDLLIQLKRLGGSKWIREQIRNSAVRKPHDATEELIRAADLDTVSLSVEKAPDNSMNAAGIPSGALLLVEKNNVPEIGDIIILEQIGLKTLRRFVESDRSLFLKAESTEANHSDYILPPGSRPAHAGIVRWVLFKP